MEWFSDHCEDHGNWKTQTTVFLIISRIVKIGKNQAIVFWSFWGSRKLNSKDSFCRSLSTHLEWKFWKNKYKIFWSLRGSWKLKNPNNSFLIISWIVKLGKNQTIAYFCSFREHWKIQTTIFLIISKLVKILKIEHEFVWSFRRDLKNSKLSNTDFSDHCAMCILKNSTKKIFWSFQELLQCFFSKKC